MDSLQEKQKYLHKQIILESYDPEQFQQFMNNQKGLDLESYTFQQIVSVVKKFKGIKDQAIDQDTQNPFIIWKPKSRISEEIIQQKKQKNIQEKVKELPKEKKVQGNGQKDKIKGQDKVEKSQKLEKLEKQKENYQKNNGKQHQKQKQKIRQSKSEYKEEEHNNNQFQTQSNRERALSINSVKAFNSSLTKSYIMTKKITIANLYNDIHVLHKNITIKIRSYSKKQSSSIFKTTYIAYLIQTSNGWSVYRRFNDFSWLYRYYKDMYQGLPVPPIPQKTTIRSFDDEHLQQRMLVFEQFLNKLLSIPDLCSDPVLESFLSIQSQQEFNSVKQRYDGKVKTKQNIVCCLKGEQLIKYDQICVKKNNKDFYEKSIQLLSRVNFQIAELQKYLKLSSDKAVLINGIFRQLATEHKKMDIPCAGVFDVMGEFIGQTGYKLDSEYYHIKNYIQNIWKYEQKYRQTIHLSIESLQKFRIDMSMKHKNVTGQTIDQSLLNQKNQVNNIENKNVAEYLQTKELYRIKLSFLLDQIQRHQHQDCKKLSIDWSQSMKKYMDGVKDMMLTGADQFTKALCVAQGKQLMEVEYLSNVNKKQKQLMIRQIE